MGSNVGYFCESERLQLLTVDSTGADPSLLTRLRRGRAADALPLHMQTKAQECLTLQLPESGILHELLLLLPVELFAIRG